MFSGYIPAVVTPFKDGKIDLQSFEKYIDWLSGSGVNGAVVCGSTGESLALSKDEHLELIKTAVRVANRRIQIIGGVISSSTKHCLELIENSAEYVDGLLCICPFYIKPTQKQLVDHFTTLSKATDKPIILYNNPGRVGINLGKDAFDQIVALKNVRAIKECAGDLSRFTLWRKDLKKDFDFLTGNDDSAWAALAMGAVGVVSVSANVCPQLCVKAFNAFKAGDFATFGKLRDILAPLHSLMFSEPSPAPAKYALSKMGLMHDELRAPLSSISDDLRLRIDAFMKSVENVEI